MPISAGPAVKAETEFGVVLNHLVKATVVVLGVVWVIRFFWPELVKEESAFDEAPADEALTDAVQGEVE